MALSVVSLYILILLSNILRLPTFHCKSQRIWSFKIEKRIEHLVIHLHGTFSQILPNTVRVGQEGGRKG